MGVLVDIVPNHVGVATPVENAWWWDLLQHGQESAHAAAFDVDWAAGGGRIRIPVVGDDDQAPDGGPIANLAVVDGELRYHDHRFPIAPGTEGDDPQEVHARQHYELVNWRVADHGLNYRRFFAVNTLAAIRVEDRAVFDESHVEIRRWFDEGLVDGLRVDHPDGLREPGRYLDDLAGSPAARTSWSRRSCTPARTCRRPGPPPGPPGTTPSPSSTGCSPTRRPEEPLDLLETRLRGAPVDWEQMVHDTKRAVADGILGSEVRRIVRELEPCRRRRDRRVGGRGRRAARLLPGLPLLPARGTRAPRRGLRPGTDAPPRPGRHARRRSARSSPTRRRPPPCASSRPAGW